MNHFLSLNYLGRIANCPEGTFTVVVHGVGYKQAERKVTFERKKTVELDFYLEPDVIALNQVVVTATQHTTSRMETPSVVSVVGSGKFFSRLKGQSTRTFRE